MSDKDGRKTCGNEEKCIMGFRSMKINAEFIERV